MEWECKAQFQAGGGDRVGLLALDSGHWGVVWAYAPTQGMQLVSYDPERAQEVFQATRDRYEGREGLSFDSRTAWQGGSV